MDKKYKQCYKCRYLREEIDIIKKYNMCIRCLMIKGLATNEMVDSLTKNK